MTECTGTLDPARVSVIILMRSGKPFYAVGVYSLSLFSLSLQLCVCVLFCIMAHFSTLMASVFIFTHTHNCVPGPSFQFLLLNFTQTDRGRAKKKRGTECPGIISGWLFTFLIVFMDVSVSYLYIKGYQRI